MRKFFQKASRLAQVLLASSISFLPAQQIELELKPGQRQTAKQEIVLQNLQKGEEVEKDTVTFNAELNSKGDEFTLEYFTKDFDRKDWKGTDKEDEIPIYRHTPLSGDMRLLIRHPNSVVVGKSEQKFFVVPEYQWQDAIPFEEHKTAQAVMKTIEGGINYLRTTSPKFDTIYRGLEFLMKYDLNKTYGNVFGEGKDPRAELMASVVENGVEEIFSWINLSGDEELEKVKEKVQETVTEKLQEGYDEMFERENPQLKNNPNYSTTRVPIYLTQKFKRTHTGFAVSIPFSGKLSENDEVYFWANPAFGDKSATSQNPHQVGFARAGPVKVKLNLNLEGKAKEKKPVLISNKTLDWYLPNENETRGFVLEERYKPGTEPLSYDQLEQIKNLNWLAYLKMESEISDDFEFREFKIPSRKNSEKNFGVLVSSHPISEEELARQLDDPKLSTPIILSKGRVINPCCNWQRYMEFDFEQECLFLNFLINYYTRVGGEIIYRPSIMELIRKSVQQTKGKEKITSKEMNNAILESWKKQHAFYNGDINDASRQITTELSQYPPSIISSSVYSLREEWEDYLQRISPEQIKSERTLFGDGYPSILSNLRSAYSDGLQSAWKNQHGRR